MMNWKKGFRRITWLLAILSTIYVITYVICKFYEYEEGVPLANWYLSILVSTIPVVGVWIIYFMMPWLMSGFTKEPVAQKEKEEEGTEL